MQKRIIILLVAVLGLSMMRVQAQDPMFSQFYANPLYLNPAMAGTNICPRLAFNFRDQWPSMPGTFLTYAASYDEHFDKIYGGIGVQFWGDRAGEGGILNTYNVSAMYSFMVKVSKKFNMRFALEAAYRNKSLNKANLTFGDMIDPRYGFVYQTNEQLGDIDQINSLDFSFGFLGYTPHLYFGLAIKHIATLNFGKTTGYSFINPDADGKFYDNIKYTAHIGANFDLKRKSKKETSFGDISISPNFIYEHQLDSTISTKASTPSSTPSPWVYGAVTGLPTNTITTITSRVPMAQALTPFQVPARFSIQTPSSSCSASNMTCSRWLIPTI